MICQEILRQLKQTSLETGDTFKTFVKMYSELNDVEYREHNDDVQVRFIPTDHSFKDLINDVAYVDFIRMTRVDMRDLRTDKEGNSRVELDNFRPDLASYEPQYRALWYLDLDEMTIDGVPIINERIVLNCSECENEHIMFVWGIEGILSTDEITEKFEKFTQTLLQCK